MRPFERGQGPPGVLVIDNQEGKGYHAGSAMCEIPTLQTSKAIIEKPSADLEVRSSICEKSCRQRCDSKPDLLYCLRPVLESFAATLVLDPDIDQD
jgi:hypothetical protein